MLSKRNELKEKSMSRIAIIFPGIGYHSDKPLLYYGKKLAAEFGYRVVEVSYSGFDTDIRGNQEKMQAAAEHAMAQAETVLQKLHLSMTDEILCISKSVGTIVAAAWQKKNGIIAKNVYFTPVEGTFAYAAYDSGIVFHGTKDPWVTTDVIAAGCEKLHLPLFITKDGNHSLECGSTCMDTNTITNTMIHLQSYILDIDMWTFADNKEVEEMLHPDAETQLVELWKEIKDNLRSLSYEPYLDDQVEFDMIWEASEEMVKILNENDEISESFRRNLIRSIGENDYYHELDCDDPMQTLAYALCKTDDDFILLADGLYACGSKKEAAELYRTHGAEEKYITYLIGILKRDTEDYDTVISYFEKTGRQKRAAEVALLGLSNCKKGNFTEIYCCLIRDALAKGDQALAEEYYGATIKKRSIDHAKIETAMAGTGMDKEKEHV